MLPEHGAGWRRPDPRVEVSGGALGGIGLAIAAQRALTALVVLVEAL